jgi:hypothetical protein
MTAHTYDATKDPYKSYPNNPVEPGTKVVAVVPDDNTDLVTYAKALYIGVTGDIAVVPIGQSTSVVFKNHPVGYFLGCRVARILSTGTTASQILALYD